MPKAIDELGETDLRVCLRVISRRGQYGSMLRMRPAGSQDRDAVRAMISARCDWMEARDLPSWRPRLDDLVAQTDNPCGDVWVLERDGQVIGRTTLQADAPPPWGWTEVKRAEPALYLTTTLTAPGQQDIKPGTLIAWWAVGQASQSGASWVRRDCAFTALAKYYQSQGYDLVREAEFKGHRLFMMARRAEHLDLMDLFHR